MATTRPAHDHHYYYQETQLAHHLHQQQQTPPNTRLGIGSSLYESGGGIAPTLGGRSPGIDQG